MAFAVRLRHRLGVADRSLLAGIKVFLFDCDGVIWKGSQTIPGAVDTLNYLKDAGKQVYYVTNNSTKSRAETANKLQSMGIHSSVEEVLTSSYATAQYLAAHNQMQDAYVVGERGIFEELEGMGIRCHGLEDNGEKDINSLLHMDPSVGTVVVGLDRNINYIKLSRAAAYIRDKKCLFVATNTDGSFPNAGGLVTGGSGCMVAAISTICGKQPDVVVGKPNSVFIDLILSKHPSIRREDILMVGDRLDTDVLFARKNQVLSMCVLTGLTSEEAVLSSDGKVAPQLYTPSIADLHSLLSSPSTPCSLEEKQ